jgi:predicted extracellular nuclease
MNKSLFRAFSAITILALVLMALPVQGARAIGLITLDTPITQNFDTLATSGTTNTWTDDSTLLGWYSQFSLQPSNPTVYIANAGSTNNGAIYSFGTGTSTERALGSVASGTPGNIFYALKLTNNTGSTITSLDINYIGEQWRNGGNTSAQQLDFQYQVASPGTITDANAPTTGWTDFNALDFVSPTVGATTTALDGNAAGNQTAKSANLPVAVSGGQEIWLRWMDINDTGNDHGLSIDDFSVTPHGGVVQPDLTINDVSLSEGNTGTTNFTFSVNLSAPAGAGGVTFDIATSDGTAQDDNPATEDNDYAAQSLPSQTIPEGSTGPFDFIVPVNGDGIVESNETFFVNVTNVTGAANPDGQGQGTIQNDDVAPAGPAVFFNEIHYDNGGPPDTGEAIEIAGPTCTDLTGWSVVLYNGSGGASYNTTALSGPIPNLGGGFGVVVVNYPSNGIQNGSPDGMALVDDGGNVIQFLSYEGTLTAVGGPANGMLSVDIGVIENGSGPVGDSLRLTGTGSTYNNFTWATTAPNTFGAFNTGQTFTGGGTTNPCGVGAATPNTVFAGDSTLLTVSVISGTSPASTGLAVTADLSAIGGSPSQTFYDDGTNGDVTPGDNIFSYSASVLGSTSPGIYSLPASVTDAQARTGSASINLTVQPGFVTIATIQGAAHISPLNGQLVSTAGVVTVVASNGFYLQNPSPDSDDATSEAIFVFTNSAPTVVVGDSLLVNGTVSEFRPGGSSTANLTTTEISSPGLSVSVQSSGNSLPAPTVIGAGGRVPPTMVIDDDATGDVETSGTFDAATDGIDFYESMEAMRVQVNNPVAVGPTTGFGEIFVLADDGAGAGVRTTRGGIVIRANDFNPERIQLDDNFTSTPMVDVGDHFTGPAVGVLDYNFGNFEILITSPMTAVSSGLTREATTAAGTDELAVATFNVENLDPGDGAAKFDELADLIVNSLQSPDIIGVEEVQDNNGATNDTVVNADITFGMLITAIQSAGGPTYDFRQINPVDDQDGGEPGGNIRVGFLFRTDRGLAFVDRSGGGSTDPTTVNNVGGVPQLSFSPGRLDPTNSAFNSSRKPLAGEFTYNGATFFVVVNHFNSKGGDNPLFGHFQPPVLNSEVQRLQQAQVVNTFVDDILAVDPDANIVIAGDLNDFEFSAPVNTVEGGVLHTLMETLPQNERYSYVFEGNSQSLDHLLISDSLFNAPFEYDVVHVNSEFAVQSSDHDPQVVRLLVIPPDTTAPSVTINQAASQADPTGASPIVFDVVFSEPVTDFDDAADVDLSASTAPGPLSAVITPIDAQNYTVSVSGMTGNGTVVASIPANAAVDAANNGNTASTSTDNTVTYSNTAPTIAVAAGGMCAASGGTLNLTVSDAEGDALTLSGSSSNTSAVPNGNIGFGGSGANRTVAITAVPASTVRTATVTITVSDGISTASTTVTVVVGTNGNNTLNGTTGADLILGLDGNDTLNGLGGNDVLCGGAKNDTLNGGDNDDTLDGGANNDILNGGAGNDGLSGNSGNDSLTGDTGADSFSGGTGNDTNVDFNAGQGDTSDGT